MPSSEEQIAQIEAAMAAQEALRPALGDATVETVLATLRRQLDVLHAPPPGPPADLAASLTYLHERGLIREAPPAADLEYIFRHALIQETAYSSLLAPQRRKLHRQVAAALETLFAARREEFQGLIGDHYLRGQEWAEAVPYLLAAGDAAAQVYAYPEAHRYYARSLEALGHLPDSAAIRRQRVDLLLRQDSVCYLIESPHESLARLTAAADLAATLPGGDSRRSAQVALALGRAYSMSNDQPTALRYYEQVLDAAAALGDDDLLAPPRMVIGVLRSQQGQFAQAQELLRLASEPLAKAGRWLEWILNQQWLGIACMGLGQVEPALHAGHAATARAHALQNPVIVSQSNVMHSLAHFLYGDYPAALAAAEAALGGEHQPGDVLLGYFGHNMRAWSLSRLDRPAEALADLAEAKVVGRQMGQAVFMADWFAAGESEVLLAAGRVAEAAALAASTARVAEESASPFAAGLAQRVWGQALAAQDPPSGDPAAHFAAARQAFTACAAPLEVARTQVAWGRFCRAQGDRAGARALWAEAAAAFAAAGPAAALAAVQALLAGL